MTQNSMYKDVLMDHYRHPRNRGDLSHADVVCRGSNPRCGDEIEVGVNFDAADQLELVMFRGRACSVCLASASMMTEAVQGKAKEEVQDLVEKMKVWFMADGKKPIESLQALDVVRAHPARKRCVLLAWEALDDTLGVR